MYSQFDLRFFIGCLISHVCFPVRETKLDMVSFEGQAGPMLQIEFLMVIDLVLSGSCRIESYGEESPDISGSGASDAVSVVMHKDCPGAVALVGQFDGAVFISGCFSSVLRDFCRVNHAKFFQFRPIGDGAECASFVMRVCADVMRGDESRAGDLRFVEGVDALDLLRSLQHISRASVLSASEALH